MLSQSQQFYETLVKAKNPLIMLPKDHNADTIASSLALTKLLEKMDKKAETVSPHFSLSSNYQFLSKGNEIKNNLSNHKKIKISLPISNGQTDPTIEQETNNDFLHLHITSDGHGFDRQNIKISEAEYKHDVIIILNTPDLEMLDYIYFQNPDLFYQATIINIDHLPENEHYGQINLINIRATSVAEIIFDLIQDLDSNLMTEEIATYLLTGMIEKTKSFKIPTITPRSLNIASQLVAAGAKRDEIIRNLYQTKTVNTLKLWGKVLMNLQTDQYQKIAWAKITENEFIETNSRPLDLYGLIDELITNIPSVELTVLFFDKEEKTFCIIKSEKSIDLLSQFRDFSPEGQKSLIQFQLAVPEDTILNQLLAII